MRALRIPCFVLLALLALSLANGAATDRRCSRWSAAVDEARQNIRAEQWQEADEDLAELQRELSGSTTWLHITTAHNAVDEAERLLARARLMCALRDGSGAEEALAELRVVLRQASENERFSLGNIM